MHMFTSYGHIKKPKQNHQFFDVFSSLIDIINSALDSLHLFEICFANAVASFK